MSLYNINSKTYQRDNRLWKILADAAIGEPVGDIFIIDSTYIKAHVDTRGGSQDMSRAKVAEQRITFGS
ncbi:hypothetical protein [Treponema endosymbiont of Eucomonympha sp.]|uniref:hypothetical protein n=1 Tax=Treponema endosymbiont of Eucomonympha sp. TaxID=1580831 RepID=UPI00164F59F4|nr:hypothetical protein [Treponema endosymbiont of Eucomonympha sp.]